MHNTRFPHAEKQARPQQVTLLQSVVICCQICADCCPPLHTDCRLRPNQGGLTLAELAMLPHSAATRGGQKTQPKSVRALFLFYHTRTREQSTGLATAGATRPLDEMIRTRDERRSNERQGNEREHE